MNTRLLKVGKILFLDSIALSISNFIFQQLSNIFSRPFFLFFELFDLINSLVAYRREVRSFDKSFNMIGLRTICFLWES